MSIIFLRIWTRFSGESGLGISSQREPGTPTTCNRSSGQGD